MNASYRKNNFRYSIPPGLITSLKCDDLARACRWFFHCAVIAVLLFAIVACGTESGDSNKTQADNSDVDTSAGIIEAEDKLITIPPVILGEVLPGLVVTDYVVVSTLRTGRTTMKYVLKLKISNASAFDYESVLATLVTTPEHIVILDASALVGDVPANSTILSVDSFTVDVDLAKSTSFDDFVWLIEGDKVVPPPPPPGPRPTATGYFMSIDDNLIKGDSTSASHKDWIVLTALMEGLRRENPSSTRVRSSFLFEGVQVEKQLDLSSVKLREAIADGSMFGEVKIDVIESCDDNLYTAYAITLSVARLDELSLLGEGSDRPTENLSFNYTRIETMFTPVADDCRLLSPVFSTQDGKLLSL